MAVTIRRAERRDVARIIELEKKLAEYDREPDAVTISLSEAEDAGFGPKPVWWGFVAEVDGVIRGYTIYYIRFSTWKGQSLWLEDIYVEPELRGRGIGRMLFTELFKEVRARQFHGMNWFSCKWNEPAHKFYTKFGGEKEHGWENGSIQLR
jgi:GNAT superfamily N-acetyltransferase